MNKLSMILALVAALGGSGAAFGAALGLTPSSQIAANGDQVTLDLLATGLGDGVSPAVGAFDVDVLYDPAVLGFNSYTIGSDLGLAFDFSLGALLSGPIDLAASSLENPADLIATQAANALLASVIFDVLDLSLGASTIVQVDANDPLLLLGDENGASLPITDVTSATIRNEIDSVPAPGTALLFVLGVIMLGFVFRTDQPMR